MFKLHVDSENLPRLRRLFRDFVYGSVRVKGALCYREEWMAEWGNVLKMREEAGKRTMPNPPAITLLVRFVMPDGSARGNNGAPCVIDLRGGSCGYLATALLCRCVEALQRRWSGRTSSSRGRTLYYRSLGGASCA